MSFSAFLHLVVFPPVIVWSFYLAVRTGERGYNMTHRHYTLWVIRRPIWEFYDRAGPMSVNGYPSFFSANVVHRDDMDILREKVGAMSLALGIPGSSS